LHKETFIGLVVHFVAHYFHYDSKFWQTLKTLITKPGRLTTAYWENKRNRYIPPISLYIFMSAVYFLIFFATPGKTRKEMEKVWERDHTSQKSTDSVKRLNEVVVLKRDGSKSTITSGKLTDLFNSPERQQELLDRTMRGFPKFFFFMIPVTSFALRIYYLRRKDLYFVDHAIFSLHLHAFAFFVLLIALYEAPNEENWWGVTVDVIGNITIWWLFVYLVIALHNVYKSGWIKSVLYGMLILLGYLFFFGLVVIGYFLYTAYDMI
jgi:hypothetical protein